MSFDLSPPEPEQGLLPGTVVAGRFRITRKLGEGGMGAVYAAQNTATNRVVALKVLHPEYAAKKEVVRRFIREAKAATAITHPNVIEVLDVVHGDAGEPVMVMELLDGEPLDAVLERRGRLPLGEVASIMLPVIEAVATAHARGIVHRDLKPENIFLANGPGQTVVPKVLDFGIAKILDPSQINELASKSGATRTGSMLGTPHYMSIEQACGEKDIDHRTDVWSMGVILYVLLSGHRPFDGDNFGQILKALMVEKPPAIAELVPGLPSDVAQMVDRCMRHKRDERPSDLREVHAVLARYAGAGGLTASLPPCSLDDLARSPTVSAPSVSAWASASSHTKTAPKRRVWIVAAAASLAMVAGAVVLLVRANHSDQAPIVANVDLAAPAQPSSAAASAEPSATASSPLVEVLPPASTSGQVPATSAPPLFKVSSAQSTASPASATAPARSVPQPATAPPTPSRPPKGGIIETMPY